MVGENGVNKVGLANKQAQQQRKKTNNEMNFVALVFRRFILGRKTSFWCLFIISVYVAQQI